MALPPAAPERQLKHCRSIDVQVSRLRQRLGDDPRSPALIKTVRGEGYVLSVPVDKVS